MYSYDVLCATYIVAATLYLYLSCTSTSYEYKLHNIYRQIYLNVRARPATHSPSSSLCVHRTSYMYKYCTRYIVPYEAHRMCICHIYIYIYTGMCVCTYVYSTSNKYYVQVLCTCACVYIYYIYIYIYMCGACVCARRARERESHLRSVRVARNIGRVDVAKLPSLPVAAAPFVLLRAPCFPNTHRHALTHLIFPGAHGILEARGHDEPTSPTGLEEGGGDTAEGALRPSDILGKLQDAPAPRHGPETSPSGRFVRCCMSNNSVPLQY